MDYHHTSMPNTDDPFQDTTAEEEEDYPTGPLDDDIWLEDLVTTTLPVFLSLPVQLGPATFLSIRCTSTIL